MKISKVEIQNYRSCLNTSFSPHPNLSVLIGPNSSGKTNILNAMRLLKRLTEHEEKYFHEERPPTAEAKLKIWFELDKKKAIFTSTIHIYTDDDNADVVVSSTESWYLKDFTDSAKRVKTPLWFVRNSRNYRRYTRRRYIGNRSLPKHFMTPSSDLYRRQMYFGYYAPEEALVPLNKISGYLSGMRYYSASQFTNPSNCPVSFEIEKEGMKSRGYQLSGHTRFLFDLYREFKDRSDGYNQFIDIVGPQGIGLVDKIDFQDIITSSIEHKVQSGGKIQIRKRDKSLVIPKFSVGKNELSPNQLSEGTFKTITLLFYLITETSSILLIEEPEVCVHHGLLHSIIELIKAYSSDKQIIISTHSDFVLDQVAPENVFSIIRTPDEGTKIKNITKTMSRNELSALRKYLEFEGNLGEYWKHGALES